MLKKKNLPYIFLGITFVLFVAFTIIVKTVDVRTAGESGVMVGLATINEKIFYKLGVSETWHKVTNLLLVMSFALAFCFFMLGVFELIKNRSIKKVNSGILALGCIYVLIVAFYFLFEVVVINNRPILVNGEIAASYPSSHTFIVLTILWTAIVFILDSVKNKWLKTGVICGGVAISIFAVIGRLLSGRHWFTDIVGGILLSVFLILVYIVSFDLFKSKLTLSLALIDNKEREENHQADETLGNVSQEKIENALEEAPANETTTVEVSKEQISNSDIASKTTLENDVKN